MTGQSDLQDSPDEIPELFAEDHIAVLKAYFKGIRYPLMQENKVQKI